MGKDLDKTRYCTNCGSTNVRAQMWVNPNTHEVYNHCTGFDEEYDNYCDCCKEFVELYTLRQLWKAFENYPVNNDDEIEADFYLFLLALQSLMYGIGLMNDALIIYMMI